MKSKKKISFDQAVMLVLAGLAGLLAAVVALGSRAGMPAPALVPAGGVVGLYGPVGLVFHERIPDGVEDKISLRPEAGGEAVPGRLAWEGSTAWFTPERPLEIGQPYLFVLESGARDRAGRALREPASWRIAAREPEIAYLGGVSAPEIWINSASGGAARRLTQVGGRGVHDFAVSPDGQRLVYSAENELGGLDLWVTSREGRGTRLLAPCYADRCSEAAFSPDGRRIAYTRGQASGAGTYPSAGVWLVAMDGQAEGRLLVGDPAVKAGSLLWSPDGKHLAFFDEEAALQGSVAPGAIRVIEVEGGTGFSAASNGGVPGSWSPDSRELWFTGADLVGEEVVTGLYLIEIESQEVLAVDWEATHLNRIGRPVWSPDGKWVTFAASEAGGSGSRLWRFSADGRERDVIVEEPFYTYGRYSWDPTGRLLVFQRLELSSSLSVPQVVVLRGESLVVIAEDAALPAWVP